MISPLARPLALSLAIVVTAAAAQPAAAETWQGRFVTAGAEVRAVNPETPYLGEVALDLRPVWRLGEDDDLLLGVVAEVVEDEAGHVYLLDSQLSEVHVLDAGGAWLRSVGRAGEGPGEFRNGSSLFWAPGDQLGVIQAWPGKIVLLRRDGSPGDTFALPFRQDGGMQIASRGAGTGDRVVLSGSAWLGTGGGQQTQQQVSYLKSFDRSGREVAHFHEATQEIRFGGWEFQEEQFVDFQRRWAAAPDGRVAAALDFAAYRIHVWNADGTLDRVIERPEFAPVKRTADEKARLQTMFDRFTRWNPRSTFKLNDVHQTVARVVFHDDGSLWVQTGRDQWRSPAGRFTSFDVYDREGRFARRVHLQGPGNAVQDGVFIGRSRLYVVTDMLDAMMNAMGGGGGTDAEPVGVVAYAFQPPLLPAGAATAATGR